MKMMKLRQGKHGIPVTYGIIYEVIKNIFMIGKEVEWVDGR